MDAVVAPAFAALPSDPLTRVLTGTRTANWPSGPITVRFGTDEHGVTTVDSTSPLLTGELDGVEHLEVRHALAVLSQVVTRRLDEGAFTERTRTRLPGGPVVRHRVTPSNED